MLRLPQFKIVLAVIAVVASLAGLQSLAVARFYSQDQHVVPHQLRVSTHKQRAEVVSNRVAINQSSSTSKDTDRDGLADSTEIRRTKTNPRKADTDADGFKDGVEVAAGSNPLDRKSTPKAPKRTPATPADTTAPETSIDTGPSGTTTATDANFSFTASEPSSTFACRLDGSTWASCGSPKTHSGLAVGSHTFSVRATDVAGNVDSTPASRSWSIGAPPPPPPADNPAHAVWAIPAAPQVDVPVTLDGSSSTGDAPIACTWSFESQDGSAVFQTQSGCKIEFTFSEAGTKYVKLTAQDVDGDTDSSKQSFEVEATVDTTPPNTTIDSGPSGATTSTSAAFAFSSSESGSSFQCQMDESSWLSCTSPQTYSTLSDGSHSFSVRAKDATGNIDPTPATRSWTVEASGPPPIDTTPPDTSISGGPGGSTTSTSASFSFASTESGSSFECKLDASAFGSCSSPKSYSGLSVGGHTFSVRATDAASNVDASPASYSWTVEASTPPPPSGSGCIAGSTNATSASAITSAVSAGKNVCVTASVGDVNFVNMGKRAVVVSTEGGSMDHLEIQGTTDLTLRSARFTSVTIRGGHRTTIEDSTIGGTPTNRSYDQLIFMPDESNDVTIEGNDIGWAKADNSGNTGYGCRCYGTLNRLHFVGNKIHDVAGDGFQGVGGSDIVIDRNEIGPVGANPDSNEHSDNIQLTYNGSNLRVTNNWIHHQGYYEGKTTGNSGSVYIHGGTSNSLLFENNLIETALGRSEICGLGTGGTSRSNITVRNNTWLEGGLSFTGFPSFEWDCDSGSGNSVERNIAVDPDGGFAQDGSASAATFANNIWGKPSSVTLDASGNCTSANCNPSSQLPIGYRKPSGVAW